MSERMAIVIIACVTIVSFASCETITNVAKTRASGESLQAMVKCAPVAQSEEHRNSTSGVAGSSPAGSAK